MKYILNKNTYKMTTFFKATLLEKLQLNPNIFGISFLRQMFILKKTALSITISS